MIIRSLLARLTAHIANGIAERERAIEWKPPHGKGTYGRNGFWDQFWVYDMTPAYESEKRWRLTVSPACPDRLKSCNQHDQIPYWGPDYDEAKQAAQDWSDRQYPDIGIT